MIVEILTSTLLKSHSFYDILKWGISKTDSSTHICNFRIKNIPSALINETIAINKKHLIEYCMPAYKTYFEALEY